LEIFGKPDYVDFAKLVNKFYGMPNKLGGNGKTVKFDRLLDQQCNKYAKF